MNNNMINLAVRFLLEIALLVITAWWGWVKFTGLYRYLLAIALPIALAAAWAIFRTEGDPGKAIVAIPGWTRLLFELSLFTCATLLLFSLRQDKAAYWFLGISLLHYLVSYDRILWLMRQK